MSIEEVRSLVAERQRYDDWIGALDARQAETPERVYQRVRGDYDARRSDVLTRLAEHVAELEMLSGSLMQQREDLTGQLDALEDQRVEAMLRNAVGEYDNDKWEALRTDVEGQITKLTDDRSLVQMELEEIQALLTQARPTPAVAAATVAADAAPSASATPAHATDAESPLADATSSEATTAEVTTAAESLVDVTAETEEMEVYAAPDAAAPHHHNADALPDVVTIAGGVNAVEPVAPVAADWSVDVGIDAGLGAVTDHTASAAPADREMDDALAMFAETPAQPMHAVPAPLENIDVHFEVSDDVLPVAPAPSPSAFQAPAAGKVPPIDPFDDLAFLHSVIAPSGSQPVVPASTMTPPSVPTAGHTAEPTKTLRCTECGTMNLPTEWYCERCGGELAAF